MQTLFITGTDTSVGKTWTTCTLLTLLASRGIQAGACKPVCSGAEYDALGRPFWADVDALRSHCSLNPPESLVCPRRFLAPLAPNIAAKLEHTPLTLPELLAAITAWSTHCQTLLIEGAGGLHCPLTDDSTVLDLIRHLNTPSILVAANRLGVISHTRITAELLQHSQLPLLGIILNDVHPPAVSSSDASTAHNADQLKHWLPSLPLLHSTWNSRKLTLLSPGQFPLANLDDWLQFITRSPNFNLATTPNQC
ncbi:MAG: dethiobiotin synthase [Planctomycetota bacterium]